jgi:hypothetical protein
MRLYAPSSNPNPLLAAAAPRESGARTGPQSAVILARAQRVGRISVLALSFACHSRTDLLFRSCRHPERSMALLRHAQSKDPRISFLLLPLFVIPEGNPLPFCLSF